MANIAMIESRKLFPLPNTCAVARNPGAVESEVLTVAVKIALKAAAKSDGDLNSKPSSKELKRSSAALACSRVGLELTGNCRGLKTPYRKVAGS